MALKESLGTLSSTLLSMVRTRLELFALELADQKSRVIGLLVLGCAALVLVLLGLLVFSVAVALYFWPTEHRYLALILLAGVYVLAGLGAFLVLRSRLVQAPLPFHATLDELHRDLALLERLRSQENQTTTASPPRD